MQTKILAVIASSFFWGCATLAHAVCDPADQIAPNPNPDGATLTLTSGTACNAADPYENLGTLNNEGTLVNEAVLANGVENLSDSTLNNYGTLTNAVGATLQNRGTLNNDGTLVNKGSLGGPGGRGVLQNNGTFVNEGFAGAYIFRNDGTLNNVGAMGEIGVGLILTNSGTVNNDGKIFAIDVLGNSGTLINNGSIEVPDGGSGNTGQLVNNGSFRSVTGFSNRGVFHNDESSRELRRLLFLREWSHEQDEQVFP